MNFINLDVIVPLLSPNFWEVAMMLMLCIGIETIFLSIIFKSKWKSALVQTIGVNLITTVIGIILMLNIPDNFSIVFLFSFCFILSFIVETFLLKVLASDKTWQKILTAGLVMNAASYLILIFLYLVL